MDKVILIESNKNEILLKDIDSLTLEINKLKDREPQIVLVKATGLGIFTIGIGSSYGFLEFMDNSYAPPYLLAKPMAQQIESQESLIFDVSGTPTPIPSRYCMHTDFVIKILVDALRSNKLPDYVEWEEV